MPSAKRARQRAGRDARKAALAKQQQRRKTVRRGITLVIVAVVVVGSVYLITRPKKTTPVAKSPQLIANAAAVKAGCPAATTTRVNTLQFKNPAQVIDPTKTYTATVKTTLGNFVITLNPKTAPIAVNSFVYLAQKKFFDCVIFHRVIPGFIDQTGDPTGTGTGGPGYEFTEAGPAVAKPQYPVGAVAMANSSSGTTDPSTNGSQWFVVAGAQGEALPPDYVLFGQVTSGMSVVTDINKDGSTKGVPPKVTQRILTVTIHES